VKSCTFWIATLVFPRIESQKGSARMKRRSFLKLTAVAGIAAVDPLGITSSFSFGGNPPKFEPKNSSGKELEAIIDTKTGKVDANPNILMRHSSCLGCYAACSNRVKVDKRNGQILGLNGNPYCPENTGIPIGFESPLEDSYLAFSSYKDMGNINRSTLCQRGNATMEAHYDPNRILVPLKRNDKRGKGKWKPITWDEVIKETVDGGKLFSDIGESHEIEGFRKIYDHATSIDPNQPELGPKSYQLAFIGGRGDGRTVFGGRFTAAFGTKNFFSHAYS
jgi:tetrathionate reductase subunit A